MKVSPQVPLSVTPSNRELYVHNYGLMTKGTGRLFMFAGDQKIEHLHKDFFGPGIVPEDADPEHLFKIASRSPIGCFASQLGLIVRYASTYSAIPYLVKMNAKTDLVGVSQKDPVSRQLVALEDVLRIRDEYKLTIVGVGYTVYLGSEYESEMLKEASQLVIQAHRAGLLSVLWMYPRGKAVTNERAVDVVAGAAGVAHCLGADFVKVNPPLGGGVGQEAQLLRQVVAAAGNTGVVCSGGAARETTEFLSQLHEQLAVGGIAGAALGRNVHQKSVEYAVAFCNAVAAIIYEGASLQEAERYLE